MSTMNAIVISTPGPPNVLKLLQRPIPQPRANEVLICIRAFGLNRSEMFTRQGHSPVQFPRILGIEAVGTIAATAPGLENQFPKGASVATAMGGMGRAFDGGYAEYACIPAKQVRVLPRTSLGWEVLGALPEMLQTAWGSVMWALELKKGERLLIRGGTSSVGLAAAAIAKAHGVIVGATTRKKERENMLTENGADEVWIDDGAVAEQIRQASSTSSAGLYDKVLELVGTVTLADSLQCARKGGTVCMAGIVGNEWYLENVNPMELIPSETKFTVYGGGVEQFMNMPLDDLVRKIEARKLKVKIGRVFKMEDIVEAHRCMENDEAQGKIVVIP
ncbi:zinc-binding alcohol dehydrogenase family protein [Aspergillus ruber CBS 135680]|uniref:Putative zinc-binding oxidoreductase n=1 Tax=Aspergillus ruber (strain CBS 135680) TaxID=1388766 RepID=A0A017S9H0_ASPRC|nr:putative zinc-binding oxidoreductase [Aspergillus ruber CBS 135680]EYE92840.1 putative zinc-binding oxidoreductase [Aspergillus ruber CBS 135680]